MSSAELIRRIPQMNVLVFTEKRERSTQIRQFFQKAGFKSADSFNVSMRASELPVYDYYFIEYHYADHEVICEIVNHAREKAKFGKRAQKRIGRLVAQTKGAEEQIAALRAENEKLRKDNAETTSSATRTRAWALEQADTRLDAYAEVASQRVRAAREDGDFDAEQEAQQALNQIAVEKGQLKQARLSLPDEEESAGVEDVESQYRQAPPPMSPAFKKWYSRNTWFGDGSSMKTKLMSEHSMEVHRQLEEQGIDPADDPELYYASIDKGMREQFPNDPLLPRTAAKTKSKSPVGGRTRSASGHSRPTFEKRGGKMKANLTDDQKRMAADMGVSQKDYAKQLYKIAKRDGTL